MRPPISISPCAQSSSAPSERPGVAKIPVLATVEFSRGVDFEDKGESQKALEHYRNALKIHPDHRDAKAAVARLELGGNE